MSLGLFGAWDGGVDILPLSRFVTGEARGGCNAHVIDGFAETK